MHWTSGILSELLSLSGLTRLSVFLPPLDILLTADVLGKKLERFQISLEWTDPWRRFLEGENYLRVTDLDASSLVGSNISWLLNKTNTLELIRMKNLTDPLNVFDFANLKSLELYECGALEYLIDVTRVNPATPSSTVFPVLESLEVSGATRLKEICHGELLHTKVHFPVLRRLEIGGCDSLRTLFSPSIARGLVKLRRLDIQHCKKIEEIVAAAEGDEETEDDNIFPQLTYLCLKNLPNLRSFSQGKYNFKWPLVKFITIEGCCNMKKFCFGSVSIPREVELDVSDDVGENVLEELNNSRKEITNFDSRRSTIRNVMEALKGNQFNPIMICGMGGIGKTTLMEQVFEKAKEEGLFDEYTMATLSLEKAPDVIQIQDELARHLGPPLEEKESRLRASKLRERLSQGSKKILVMLDNVSTTTPDFLWDLGIPLSCKLLVTSRQQDLFKDMDTRKNFPIHGLPDTDAWSLFKKTAGSSIESDRELEVVAKEVLKECAGLPIAISTVGTALKGEDIAVWKNALRELKKANPENVPGVIEHVYGKIKFSYECLPSEQARSCFLLCCIFPESADIEIEDLARYGLGLKLFKGIDSMVEGRNCIETLVQTLKYRLLLLESDVSECVRMHDVVRDVGVHIASEVVEKKNDEVGKRIVVRDRAETVKLMGWPKDSNSEQSIYCSSLSINGLCQLLVLRTLYDRFGSQLEPPPTIFNRMEDLKVLAMTGKSKRSRGYLDTRMLSLVPPLLILKNLQTLRLEWCDLERDVSVIGGLRTLMILSLRKSNIKELPETFKNLSNMRLFDLSECEELQIISPGVISSLSRLEELYMWGSFNNWVVDKLTSTETTNWISQLEAEERAGSEEVNKWKRITTLAAEQPANQGEINGLLEECEERRRWAKSMDWTSGIISELLSLSGLTRLSVNLPPLDTLLTTDVLGKKLERFQISLGWTDVREYGDTLSENNLIVTDLDASSLILPTSWLLNKTKTLVLRMKNLTDPLNVFDFANLKSLILEDCDALEYLIDVTRVNPATPRSTVFPVLESLRVGGATRLKEICHGELLHTKVWFPMLERLTINGLPKLTTIWHTQVAPNSFCRLRDITVQKCNGLKNIFPDSIIATAFQQLQKLTVEDCGVEEIVAEEEGLEKLMPDHFFPKLECLELKTLFQLERFYPRMHAAFSWPLLKTLVLFDCRKVDIFAAEFSSLQITHDSGSLCTPIKKSSVLFDKSTFPRLEDLTFGPMDIWYGRPVPAVSCEKALFHTNSSRHTDGSVPPLRRLRLHGMEKLMCLCKNAEPAGPDIPHLEILEVESCGLYNLELFAISFQNLTSLEVTFCWRLQYLTTYSVAKSLVKLKKLKVDECKSMIQVIAVEDASNCEIVFSQLQHLELSDLINLERFCSRNCTVKVPSLETSALEVKWCPFKLKISSDKVLEEDFSDMHLPVQKSPSRKEEPNLGKQLPSKQVDDVQIKSWSQSLSKLDADRSRLQEELRAIEAERRETEQKLADATGGRLSDSSGSQVSRSH